jgi:hypothetical protein
MIEAGTENGRGSPVIFSRPKDHDCVGRLQLLFSGIMHYGVGEAGEQDR